jgi:hypothetical protein
VPGQTTPVAYAEMAEAPNPYGDGRAAARIARPDLSVATLHWPFEGLPLPWDVLFGVAFVVVVSMFGWTVLLFVRGWWAEASAPHASAADADHFTWVFLVPALNEEVTIRDSVQRLLDLDLAHRRVLVIDDGSDDRTPEILAAVDHPDLLVLRRDRRTHARARPPR